MESKSKRGAKAPTKTTTKTTTRKPLAEKEYRLVNDRSGNYCWIKSGRNRKVLTFDEGIQRNRAIRHCPNELSIFIDEQTEYAIVEPIGFTTGYLRVPATNVLTQEFLDKHPDNIANGGNWFELIDAEQESMMDIEIEDIITDVKAAIKAKAKEEEGIYELQAVATVLKGSFGEVSKMTAGVLRMYLNNKVEEDPYFFVNDSLEVNVFDNNYTVRKYIALKAMHEGIIKKSPTSSALIWGDSNSLIIETHKSADLVEYFVDFLATDEGLLVLDDLNKKVS